MLRLWQYKKVHGCSVINSMSFNFCFLAMVLLIPCWVPTIPLCWLFQVEYMSIEWFQEIVINVTIFQYQLLGDHFLVRNPIIVQQHGSSSNHHLSKIQTHYDFSSKAVYKWSYKDLLNMDDYQLKFQDYSLFFFFLKKFTLISKYTQLWK